MSKYQFHAWQFRFWQTFGYSHLHQLLVSISQCIFANIIVRHFLSIHVELDGSFIIYFVAIYIYFCLAIQSQVQVLGLRLLYLLTAKLGFYCC